MKAIKENFKPFNITLTIESEEELRILRTICSYNVSIPEMLEEYNIEKENTVEVLRTIKEVL